MSDAIERYEIGDKIVEIFQDDGYDSPRDWDNLGTMVCFHKRYTLGDKDHGVDDSHFDGWSEIEDYLIKEKHAAVILPMYMYDHSGITINTKGFSCPWDSGQIGFIYVSREKLLEQYEVKKLTKKILATAKEVLEGEVKTYDQYLTGDVYGFKISHNEKCDKCNHTENVHEDSCWGFYGSDPVENGMIDHFPNEIKEAFVKKEAKLVERWGKPTSVT